MTNHFTLLCMRPQGDKMKSEGCIVMAVVYKLRMHGGEDNTASLPHNHLYISSCKIQLAGIFTTAIYV